MFQEGFLWLNNNYRLWKSMEVCIAVGKAGKGKKWRKSKFARPTQQRPPAPVTIKHDPSIIKKATK